MKIGGPPGKELLKAFDLISAKSRTAARLSKLDTRLPARAADMAANIGKSVEAREIRNKMVSYLEPRARIHYPTM